MYMYTETYTNYMDTPLIVWALQGYNYVHVGSIIIYHIVGEGVPEVATVVWEQHCQTVDQLWLEET